MNDLKKLVFDLMKNGKNEPLINDDNARIIRKLYQDQGGDKQEEHPIVSHVKSFVSAPDLQSVSIVNEEHILDAEEYVEESLSLEEKEKEMIIKALDKYNGKRKYAAEELGISERTLYRKIKEYDISK
jgi:transcriptional regulator of acetoin/glycerol metabolism